MGDQTQRMVETFAAVRMQMTDDGGVLLTADQFRALTAERDAAIAEVARLDAEVERCHERLEMTFHWRVTDIATGDVERVDIPRAERSFHLDGISCRDETIKSPLL